MCPPMGALTVAKLAANPSLRLRVLGPSDKLEGLVRGVHVSDLEHPARYVLPGELVLTNGLWLDTVDAATWIREVREAGSSAVAFGLRARGDEVPEAVVAACASHDVPLLEAPDDLSFSAIAELVREYDGEDGHARVQLLRLRRLLGDLARGEGHEAVLELLRRETRLQVWLIGPGGKSLTAEPCRDPAAARDAARAARQGALPCAVSADLSAFGVGGDALLTTVVVVDAPLAEVDDDARLIIEQVAAYVVLEDARRRERDAARTVLAEELVRLLWDGEIADPAFAARLQALGFPADATLVAVASSNAPGDLAYAAAGCGRSCVTARHRGMTLLLIETDDDSVILELGGLIQDGGEEPTLGSGQPRQGRDGVRRTLVEAVTAHHVATGRPHGERVVTYSAVDSHVLLLDFVDPQILRSYHESVLGEIDRWDADHQSGLITTLITFLEHDGRWGKAAEALHVHRNTLRYRLEKIAELSGRDVDTTSGRVDLALALTTRSLLRAAR